MTRMIWGRGRDHRGQALVEFALILPVFILILVGLFDMGRAVYGYNTISNAARQAVRVAIVDQTPANIQAAAQRAAVDLGIPSTCNGTNPGVCLRFLNPDLSTTAPCNATPVLNGCLAEITVRYRFSAATPLIGSFIGPINMSAVSRLPVERTYP